MHKFAAFVLLVALVASGAGCKRKAEPTAPSADVSTADRDRLQGTWGIETFDDGRAEELSPAEKAQYDERTRQVRFRFAGDKLTIVSEGRETVMMFSLGETQTPKVMKMTESADATESRATFRGTRRGDGPPAKREPEVNTWIYKFDGETLVIALVKGDDKERPTEFKARAPEYGPGKFVAGVTLVTLKKTDVPPRASTRTPVTTRRSSPATAGSRGTTR